MAILSNCVVACLLREKLAYQLSQNKNATYQNCDKQVTYDQGNWILVATAMAFV